MLSGRVSYTGLADWAEDVVALRRLLWKAGDDQSQPRASWQRAPATAPRSSRIVSDPVDQPLRAQAEQDI